MSATGRVLRLSLFGSSRGPGVGALLEGCPAGLPLAEADLAADLDRRRSGGPGTSARVEPDLPAILAGVHEGRTTGQPLLLWFDNAEARADDAVDRRVLPRPGHADLAAVLKYGGHVDLRGGGPFSGRITAPLVAAGAVARKLLPELTPTARVLSAGGRPDALQAASEAASDGDSVGARLECRVDGVPAGLGEPPLDPLDARLAALCLCIPGVRAFEIGDGWALADARGSEANDVPLDAAGRTRGQRSGGVSGGISNGNPLLFRVAARPTPSIAREQQTVDLATGEPAPIRCEGRNDACFGLRLPVVLEAVAALVLADFARISGRLGPVYEGP
jgi:chorismate synthase